MLMPAMLVGPGRGGCVFWGRRRRGGLRRWCLGLGTWTIITINISSILSSKSVPSGPFSPTFNLRLEPERRDEWITHSIILLNLGLTPDPNPHSNMYNPSTAFFGLQALPHPAPGPGIIRKSQIRTECRSRRDGAGS
jgi:hypothetical protein